MLHSRQNSNKIKHLHERCLRLIYYDKLSYYEELLEKDGSVSMWKSKTRVTSSNSPVASSNPRVMSSNPQVTSSNSRVTSSNPQVTSSNS